MYSIEDFEAMSKEDLKKLLLKASDSYYNQSVSIMTDEEYDNGFKYFTTKYPEDDLIKTIGSTVKTSEWQKATHKIPMSSLNKVNSIDDFKDWANTIGDKNYILMDKCDGGSINLEYLNGNLVKAITRGNGIEGENILKNVLKMNNVKKTINRFTGSIRGEVLMFISDFETVNKILRDNGEKELSNPRNAANGLAKRYDGRFSEYLTILFYDVTGDWNTEEEKLLWLKQNDIRTCFWIKCNVEQCIAYYNEYEKHLRAETPYDIDGLVIRANSIDLQKRHGELNENPKAQIAWKFASVKVETVVECIEWSHGQNMRITPIALLKPTKIGGVIVKRASLHNMDVFRALNLGKGDKVIISRRNDVIPYVEKVVEHVGHIKFKHPLSCPLCNEELVESEKFLVCENTECKGLRIGNLKKWVNALDIDDISDKTIELFEKAGLVSSPADFYKLDINVIANLEGMGLKSAKKIVDNFNAKKEIDLVTFIDGLNINNFAGSRAEILIKAGIDTLDKMLSISEKELVNIKGIGKEVANAIVYGLSKKKTTIKNLLEVIKIKENKKSKEVKMASKKLEGKIFVFTGAINRIDDNGKRFTREMMQNLVYENGGMCEDFIKKNVTHLVQADPNSMSTKTKKAKELGIEIISEADFFNMIEM